MRGVFLFVGGIVFGITIQFVMAQNKIDVDSSSIYELNHVGISVPDLDEAVDYYRDTLGFPEAFRVKNDAGATVLVYMQVSDTTFVELQPANESRAPGLNHFGLHVKNMDDVRERFMTHGANVMDIRGGSTGAILSNVMDLNGHRIELSEYPPDSLQGKFLGL